MIRKFAIFILLLCAAATTYFTVVSFHPRYFYCGAITEFDTLQAQIKFGSVMLVYMHTDTPRPMETSIHKFRTQDLPDDALKASLENMILYKIRWYRPTIYGNGKGFSHAIILPFWVPLGLFMLYPSIVFIHARRRRRRRRLKGLCLILKEKGFCASCRFS